MRQTEQLLAFLNIVYTPNRLYIMHGAVFFMAQIKENQIPTDAKVKMTAIK